MDGAEAHDPHPNLDGGTHENREGGFMMLRVPPSGRSATMLGGGGARGRRQQPRSHVMKWETPTAIDFRFGMEITMYIANR